MADQTFRSGLAAFRRRYAALRTKAARHDMLDELKRTFGFDRKYLNKLPRGKRSYRPPRGRGRTYGPEAEQLVISLRNAAGDRCAPYLKATLGKVLRDYGAEHPGAVGPAARGEVLSMSAATMGRIYRRHPLSGPRHHAPGAANPLKNAIPACPGKAIEDGRPGVCQFDSVMHGGGLPEPCFYTEHLTDAETQWDELGAAWNRGASATRQAFDEMAARMPFPIRKLHPDNGGEFMNGILLTHIATAHPEIAVYRSRPSHPNDNCRIEQKNGAVDRPRFGNARLDDPGIGDDLKDVCRRISLYTNLFVPSKRQVARRAKPGRGVGYVYRYDSPKTPLERLAACEPGNPNLPRLRRLYEETNSIEMFAAIRRDIAALVRRCQAPKGDAARRNTASPASPFGVQAIEQKATVGRSSKRTFGVLSI